ncbi:MAG: hypothetical protein IPJ84_07615 [Bdellovibrionales bacterium]|nr:hypothetical protein [Bdellovibrionales bacterium]
MSACIGDGFRELRTCAPQNIQAYRLQFFVSMGLLFELVFAVLFMDHIYPGFVSLIGNLVTYIAYAALVIGGSWALLLTPSIIGFLIQAASKRLGRVYMALFCAIFLTIEALYLVACVAPLFALTAFVLSLITGLEWFPVTAGLFGLFVVYFRNEIWEITRDRYLGHVKDFSFN